MKPNGTQAHSEVKNVDSISNVRYAYWDGQTKIKGSREHEFTMGHSHSNLQLPRTGHLDKWPTKRHLFTSRRQGDGTFKTQNAQSLLNSLPSFSLVIKPKTRAILFHLTPLIQPSLAIALRPNQPRLRALFVLFTQEQDEH